MPVDPATEAIANQIIDNLIAQLQCINQVAGYQITCTVEDADSRGNATGENKIIVEMASLAQNPVVGESNRDHYAMKVNLYCLAPASQNATTKPRTRLLRMHAAVWKCLRENLAHTLGSIARDTLPEGEFGEYKSGIPAMVIPLTITFDTIQNNPFER